MRQRKAIVAGEEQKTIFADLAEKGGRAEGDSENTADFRNLLS
jgi:hypothetical protein